MAALHLRRRRLDGRSGRRDPLGRRDHRKHHAFSDKDGDPHSPYEHGGEGFSGAVKGLWHAHVGWLWEYHATSDYKRYARDLYEDPTMRRIPQALPGALLLTFLVPFVMGYVATGFT